MTGYPCLSKKQIEIMIKYYYMKSLVKVSKDENITTNQVKRYLSNGFRTLRLAYAPMFREGLYFDGFATLKNMAEASGFAVQELSDILQQYIEDGLLSADRKYWEHIVGGRTATPIDLISFLWTKFEADIVPIHVWDLFGR